MRPATLQLRVKLSLFGALGLTLFSAAPGAELEPHRPLAKIIDAYVHEGLQSNLALRAQTPEVERSAAALDAARARYFPEAALQARYTRAEGGRVIELPLGDALNPAYQTLNDLLVAQVQQPQFPVVQNEVIPFLREQTAAGRS